MSRIGKFKKSLAQIFDDNLHTVKWHNLVDYTLIGLILISTVTVFISTFDMSPQVERSIHIIDLITTIIFTVEVTLRIWVADLVNPKYKGFWGRVHYCFSFYGLLDILATYPFYLSFFMPVPYTLFKVLRIARLLRIFRYMRSFRLLTNAIRNKKQEMLISLQFIGIVTIILSFVLFFFEHNAQPDVYQNGISSAVWAFMQYIGDPGGFADMPPITTVGRIIAVIIGILGIAIFAVPAGLIGAGFSESLAEENRNDEIKENVSKLERAFERKLDRPTGFQVVPPFLSIVEIQARMGMSEGDIIDSVDASDNFRLANLACTQTINEHPQDKLVVEHFQVNRPYGQFIDRGSKVTIFTPSNITDPVIGYFAYYIAKIGGFNFVSREIGETRPYRSYYKFVSLDAEPNLKYFMEDMNYLSSREDAWVITVLAQSGGNEPNYPTKLEFTAGGNKGNEDIHAEGLTVKDAARFGALIQEATAIIKEEFDLDTCFQRYHGIGLNGQNLYTNKLDNAEKLNSFSLLVAWSACLWDSRRIALAKRLAEVINNHLEPEKEKKFDEDLETKRIGY